MEIANLTSHEFKAQLAERLQKAGDKMNGYQKLELALNLKISPMTVERYTSGKVEEVRRLELADKIEGEAVKIIERDQSKA
jgi:hypothetical protein